MVSKITEQQSPPSSHQAPKLPALGRSGRLAAHLSDPLFKNAYALIANTTLTSILGIPYWVLAARLYPAAQVGAASAAISTMLLISGIALLNWEGALARFLPRSGKAAGRLLLGAYGVTVTAAVVATALFFLVFRTNPSFTEFTDSGLTVFIWFGVAVVAWCLFSLQDSALIGLRAATWIAIENGVFGVMKIVLLVVFAGVSVKFGIFTSWMVPVLLSLAPVNYLIFRRLLPKHSAADPGAAPVPIRRLTHFVAVDGLGALFALATKNLLPVVVAARIGAEANAYFYVAWVMVTALELLAQNLGASLTVEGSRDESKLSEFSAAIWKRILTLVVPLALGVAVFAPMVLAVFKEEYAAESTLLLRLLALAVLPRAATSLWTSVARVQGRVSGIVLVQGAIFALVVGLSYPLMDRFGITGIGIAYLATQTIVALALAPSLARVIWPRFAKQASA